VIDALRPSASSHGSRGGLSTRSSRP
jgi:hypothetical protein